MPQLEGARIGPLDPDAAESFGQVNASSSARQLMRHHLALYPPQLLAVLRLKRNDLRSEALDRDEVVAAGEALYTEDGAELPDEFEVNGVAVRGEEDSKKYVTFTYKVPSGRTAKGAVPYDEENFSASIELGDEAIAVDKAKQAGMPWVPKQVAEALGAGDAARKSSNKESKSAARVKELEAQVAERDQQIQRMRDEGAAPPQGPAGAAEPVDPALVDPNAEPYEGYDADKADEIVKKVKDGDAALAQRVLAYESAGANRSTVTAAANAKLDKPAE